MTMMVEFKRLALGNEGRLSDLFYINWNGRDQLVTLEDDYTEDFHPLVRFDLTKNTEHRIVLSNSEVILITVNQSGHINRAVSSDADGELLKFMVPVDHVIMQYVTIPVRLTTLLKTPGRTISL